MTRSRPLQLGTRRFADLLRSFDYVIWALIFGAIGLGPLAGIMAIAIVETGNFIKLYFGGDREPRTASRSTASTPRAAMGCNGSASGCFRSAADDASRTRCTCSSTTCARLRSSASWARAAIGFLLATACAPTSCRRRASTSTS